MKSYLKLKAVFKQLALLKNASQILQWDEAVIMPVGAEPDRVETLAMLNCLTQKLLVTNKNEKLIAEAKLEGGLTPFDAANLRWMDELYIRSACVTPKLTEKITRATLTSEQAWRKLRGQNNWRKFMPYFTKVLNLSKEIAKRQGEVLNLNPYDALLNKYAPGFNQASIDPIFENLKQKLPDMIQAITRKQAGDSVQIPEGPFEIEKQKQLGLKAMQALQFDFEHGRLDVSHHPFCGGDSSDVRITTRYNENEFLSSLMAVCHETGHGLYEQGLPREWIYQPVGEIGNMAMHESQSLMLEMQVCSSRAFFEFMLLEIKNQFGNQPAFTANNLYKLATRIKPQLIRVNSDEVTYQMHIILRYEIEKKLFNDELKVQDIPEYWDELMQKYLGLSTADDFKDGVMQDVHWPCGAFGYFPAYSLGRLVGAQFFASFIKSQPQFFEIFAHGDFQPLRKWLYENIYAYAASLPTNDLLLKVTGKELDANYFLDHVKQHYF